MSGRRVVLISRGYWPICGSQPWLVQDLAHGLRDRGWDSMVVTTAVEPRWPREMFDQGIPVIRLPLASRVRLARNRFLPPLLRWLQANRPDIDLVWIAKLGSSAAGIAPWLASAGVPLVIRCAGRRPLRAAGSRGGDRRGQRLIAQLKSGAAVVATGDSVLAALQEPSLQLPNLRRVRDGTPWLAGRTVHDQQTCRQALAEANHDLIAGQQAPVALATGPLDSARQLHILVHAWRVVAARHPGAQLWIVGDGPLRNRLWQQIRDLELVGQVLLPGSFDCLEELITAADLFVRPGGTQLPRSLLMSAASGLPLVVADSPERADCLRDVSACWRVPAGQTSLLADALLECIEQKHAVAQLSQDRGVQRVRARHSLERMATEYSQLFMELSGA